MSSEKNLLNSDLVYKPFRYEWAYEAWQIQQRLHWLPEEVSMADDVYDWNHKLTKEEKNLLTQIFRFFTQADIEVNNCYMKHYSRIFKPTEICMMLASFSNIECFDKESELLTKDGWKKCPNITQDDLIAQYDINTRKISFVNPLKVVKYPYNGKMHYYKNKTTDICVTPNHDLILERNGITKKKKSFEGGWGRNFNYPSSGLSLFCDDGLSDYEKLLIAIQADGCLRGMCPKSKTTHRTCDIHLVKERKILYIKDLLLKLNIKYSEKSRRDGSFVFTFSIPDGVDINKIKNFDFIDLEKTSTIKAKQIIDELIKWDGSINKNNNQKIYYNTNEEAIDKIQSISCLADITCTKGVNKNKIGEKIEINKKIVNINKCCYCLTFINRSHKTYPHRIELDYDDFVYCVSVPTQNLVSRRNGRVAITGNTIHVAAYSYLLDSIGMPETEYSAFLDYKQMKDKCDIMESFNVESKEDIALTLAAFGAYTEGVQLFASFAMLLNFPRFNKMKGMGQIIEWSVRDESLHCESIIKLFKTFIKENKEIWTHELKERIKNTCIKIVEAEDKFIDLCFELGGVEGMTSDDIKQYIRYIADRRSIQLGIGAVFKVKKNPIPWLDYILNASSFTNFFENRVTDYSRSSTLGTWNDVWNKFDDFLEKNEKSDDI